MEMRKVSAGAQVLRNLSSRVRRELAIGLKHSRRVVCWNKSISKFMILKCGTGDEASDSTSRARVDGTSQGRVFGS